MYFNVTSIFMQDKVLIFIAYPSTTIFDWEIIIDNWIFIRAGGMPIRYSFSPNRYHYKFLKNRRFANSESSPIITKYNNILQISLLFVDNS